MYNQSKHCRTDPMKEKLEIFLALSSLYPSRSATVSNVLDILVLFAATIIYGSNASIFYCDFMKKVASIEVISTRIA